MQACKRVKTKRGAKLNRPQNIKKSIINIGVSFITPGKYARVKQCYMLYCAFLVDY